MASCVASQSITKEILAFILLFFSLPAFSLQDDYRSSSMQDILDKIPPPHAGTPAPGESGSPYAKFNLESIWKCGDSGRFGIGVRFLIAHEDYDPDTWITDVGGMQGSMYIGWKLATVPVAPIGLQISTTTAGRGLLANVTDKRPGFVRVSLENCNVINRSETPLVGDSIQFAFRVTPAREWMSPVIDLHYLNEKIKMW
ncbi:hypothetical protein [Endozoicomonas sp. SESOKO1]|uniref:hypothetical protein n=1 Tax=Endozoicomonas sp. SESOKO1 TaxID=2828742 RepID=UPI002148B178|nr:hypothetical protein [Endozoicomonas sp. SESOKO1]